MDGSLENRVRLTADVLACYPRPGATDAEPHTLDRSDVAAAVGELLAGYWEGHLLEFIGQVEKHGWPWNIRDATLDAMIRRLEVALVVSRSAAQQAEEALQRAIACVRPLKRCVSFDPDCMRPFKRQRFAGLGSADS